MHIKPQKPIIIIVIINIIIIIIIIIAIVVVYYWSHPYEELLEIKSKTEYLLLTHTHTHTYTTIKELMYTHLFSTFGCSKKNSIHFFARNMKSVFCYSSIPIKETKSTLCTFPASNRSELLTGKALNYLGKWWF